MRDKAKTKEQLIDELTELRQRVAKLEASEAQRKEANEELERAQKYAQDLINSSLDMIIAVDEHRRITEFNRAAQKAFGYSREEILGKHVGILYDDPGKGSEINESIRKTGRITGEVINKRKNGELFPSFLSASVLRDTEGRFMGFMGISRDITELKRIEERLRQSEKMASLGRLVAGATHELSNPINFIYSNIPHLRTYVQDIKTVLSEYHDAGCWILDAPQFDRGRSTGEYSVQNLVSHIQNIADRMSEIENLKEQMDFGYTMRDLDILVDNIDEGARRIKGIVGDLGAFSRSDEGRIQDTDINEDIEKSLSLLADHYRGRITIHTEYAELPRVKCYAGQPSQVFMNLITNACQAIEGEGDIWITSRLEDHTVVISIRDNGVGIAKEHINRIFDPFFTTRDVGDGTGLGLSISYSIIQRHKGELLVDSRPGSGTTFTIRIPVDFDGQDHNRTLSKAFPAGT